MFEDGDEPQQHRGIQKGQIIEVWGPPASGKTTFAYDLNRCLFSLRHVLIYS